ncbi:MAG: GTP-binding protein, partial [Gammaproteobacteria bacterium]|nr:GTP-binding protein [Gammaproteobacteria bacterium]
MAHQTQDTLNVAFIGSGGVGKTSLVEALLHKAGVINAQGSVDAGDTVSDFLPAEKESKHSIDPSFMSFAYANKHLTVVDTPGFHDYLGRTLSVLPAVETAVLVVDATSGIDTYAQRLFSRAGDRGLCRMVVVSKIDAENADAEGLVDQLQISIGSECLPINLPAESGKSVVDCFFEQSETEPDFDSFDSAHEKILDQVVEVDEDLMELYLEQGDDLPKDQLHAAFETALRDGHLIPICFVSAETGTGVSEFLDIGCKLLPNPTEANPPPFRQSTANGDAELDVESDSSGALLAHVSKVSIDPFRGRMAVVRVHQGTLKSGSQVYVGSDRKPTKIAHIFRLVGGEQIEIDEAVAGDICALPRMETVTYNGILHESRDEQRVHMEPIPIPLPVLGKAVHVPNDNEAQKVSEVLHNIALEDPSFKVVHVAALNETVIRGMGELHLREIVERIEKQQG